MLTGEQKGQGAVAHQCQTFAIRAVHGINRLHRPDLLAQILGQVGYGHGTDVDDLVVPSGQGVEFRVHLNPLFPQAFGSTPTYSNGLDDCLGHGSLQINVQQPMFHAGATNLDPICQYKAPLKSSGSDPAMQENAVLHILGLPAPDDQLPVLDCYRQIILTKTCDSQRDAVGILGGGFDIEGGITFPCGLGCPLYQPFKLLKAQQERVCPKTQFRHSCTMPFAKATFSASGPGSGTLSWSEYGGSLCTVQDFGPLPSRKTWPSLSNDKADASHQPQQITGGKADTMQAFFCLVSKGLASQGMLGRLLCTCLLGMGPALGHAQSPTPDLWMTPQAFHARVQGQVMRTQHMRSGRVFGHEAFGPDQSVVWQYPDGRCLFGQWQDVGGSVCYRYDGAAAQSCLRYRIESDQLIGHQWRLLLGDWGDSGEKLLLTPDTTFRMTCSPAPNS